MKTRLLSSVVTSDKVVGRFFQMYDACPNGSEGEDGQRQDLVLVRPPSSSSSLLLPHRASSPPQQAIENLKNAPEKVAIRYFPLVVEELFHLLSVPSLTVPAFDALLAFLIMYGKQKSTETSRSFFPSPNLPPAVAKLSMVGIHWLTPTSTISLLTPPYQLIHSFLQ